MSNHLAQVKEFRLKLYPTDFAKSRHFYEIVLGWPVSKEWDRGEMDKGTMFQVSNTTLELLSPEDDSSAPYSGTGLSLEVADVRALAAYLQGKCEVAHELRHNDWGDTSFGVYDPEGYKIVFFTKD